MSDIPDEQSENKVPQSNSFQKSSQSNVDNPTSFTGRGRARSRSFSSANVRSSRSRVSRRRGQRSRRSRNRRSRSNSSFSKSGSQSQMGSSFNSDGSNGSGGGGSMSQVRSQRSMSNRGYSRRGRQRRRMGRRGKGGRRSRYRKRWGKANRKLNNDELFSIVKQIRQSKALFKSTLKINNPKRYNLIMKLRPNMYQLINAKGQLLNVDIKRRTPNPSMSRSGVSRSQMSKGSNLSNTGINSDGPPPLPPKRTVVTNVSKFQAFQKQVPKNFPTGGSAKSGPVQIAGSNIKSYPKSSKISNRSPASFKSTKSEK